MVYWDREFHDKSPEYYKVRNLLIEVVLLAIKDKDWDFIQGDVCEKYCAFIGLDEYNIDEIRKLAQKDIEQNG
jgi:hypothetical protein